MSREAVAQSVVGALVVGASVLSGDPTLLAVAGGVGVNLVSDALPALWQGLSAPEPGSALALAHARALRAAVKALEEDYRRTVEPRGERTAFALLADSADSLARRRAPLPVTTVAEAEQVLADGLAQLLHGHEARQVAWIQARLLAASARAFRTELERDERARSSFLLQLVEPLSAQMAALGIATAELPTLLAALTSQQGQLDAIQRSQAALEALLQQRAAQAGTLYHETAIARGAGSESRVENEGDGTAPPPLPASGTLFSRSALVEEGGRATTINRRAPPPAAPPPDSRRPILALFADPAPRDVPLDLLREGRVLEEALAAHRAHFRLTIVKAATVDDVAEQLLALQPRLLHLSGHGTRAGFRFCNALGEQHVVAWGEVAAEIVAHAPPLQALLLAACHSAAEAIQRCAPHVIAMPGALDDQATIAFVRGFYHHLAARPDELPGAYHAGCRRLRQHHPHAALPTLYP